MHVTSSEVHSGLKCFSTFICDLLKDAVTSSIYTIASNARVVNKNKLERA